MAQSGVVQSIDIQDGAHVESCESSSSSQTPSYFSAICIAAAVIFWL